MTNTCVRVLINTRQQNKSTKIQLSRGSVCLYHITNCCLMFVSSWLKKHKQIQPQSSEALNCDLFCQSCENKGRIKCPATTERWSNSGSQESEVAGSAFCLGRGVSVDFSFLIYPYWIGMSQREECLCLLRNIIMRSIIRQLGWIPFYSCRPSSAFSDLWWFIYFRISPEFSLFEILDDHLYAFLFFL